MEGDKNWLQGKWTEVKGEIRKKWGEISENDIEKTKGNLQSLAGLIEQKVGLAKNEVDKFLHDMGERFSATKDKAEHNVAESANHPIDDAKDKLKH